MALNINHVTFQKIRKGFNLTQAEIGAVLGMSNVNVHHIEKGNRALSAQYKARLIKEFSLDAEKIERLVKEYDEKQELAGDKARALYKISNKGD